MSAPDLLVWIDLEMTGLDVSREEILEIATIVTDAELRIVAEGPDLVIHQPDALLDGMDAWNTEHHGKSGLTARSRASSITTADASAQTLAFLESVGVKPNSAPLAGNSIHQDRIFLAKYMPAVERHVHYRNVDVSTIKELVKRWMPAIYEARPTKKASHRALDDIKESIEELRYYRSSAFRP
jgi:oligoribonuclease